MNGVHDLGGMDGFGPVEVEVDEPVFHQPWEGRVFGLVSAIAAQRVSTVDEFRHAIERMEPMHYLTSPYYEHWLTALITLLIEKKVITREELESRISGALALSQPTRGSVPPVAAARSTGPQFAVGAPVVVRNMHPLGHTRCPRYVRGKRGRVVRIDGTFRLPDAAAHGGSRRQEYTYSVRFETRELWGGAADSAAAVHVDLWESYLEAP